MLLLHYSAPLFQLNLERFLGQFRLRIATFYCPRLLFGHSEAFRNLPHTETLDTPTSTVCCSFQSRT